MLPIMRNIFKKTQQETSNPPFSFLLSACHYSSFAMTNSMEMKITTSVSQSVIQQCLHFYTLSASLQVYFLFNIIPKVIYKATYANSVFVPISNYTLKCWIYYFTCFCLPNTFRKINLKWNNTITTMGQHIIQLI